ALASPVESGGAEWLLDSAVYLEDRQPDKAVLLYHRAGRGTRATELAFRSRQFSALHYVTAELGQQGGPEAAGHAAPALMTRCAEFMLENKQWDRAVDLLAATKQWRQAIALCAQYNVPLTESLMTKLTPSEKDSPDRAAVLEGLAELCAAQG